MTRRTLSAFLLAASLLTGAALIGTAPAGADADKVTICHAAGLDGTTHYVTLTISENAVYKAQGGHFYENGTPQAGHEQDYFGPCVGDTTTTTEPDEPTTTTTTTVPVPEVKPPKPKPGITIGGLDTVKPVPATPDPVEVAPTFNG